MGQVIGVVVAKLDAANVFRFGGFPEGVGYAVKATYLMPLLDALDSIRPERTVKTPYLQQSRTRQHKCKRPFSGSMRSRQPVDEQKLSDAQSASLPHLGAASLVAINVAGLGRPSILSERRRTGVEI